MVAVELPSISCKPLRLSGILEMFFNSINSLLGNPTTGEGSIIISSIIISYRFMLCEQELLMDKAERRQIARYFMTLNSCFDGTAPRENHPLNRKKYTFF